LEYQGFPQCFPSHAPRVLVQDCACYPSVRTATTEGGRALLLSNSGVADGELNRLFGIETQYPNLIRVPEKMGDWCFAAFSKDASIPGNFDAIRGRTVGFIRGWKIYEREKLLPCLEGGMR